VVGGTTFGKGSVQTLFSLTGGNVLKLTTARWYTPAGRSIERVVPAGDEEAEGAGEDARPPALAIDGRFVFPADTAGRPTVTSMGGRTLYGGGGIVPDRISATDTLSADEQRAVRTLFMEGGRFTVGLFDFAVQYLGERGQSPSTAPSGGAAPPVAVGDVELQALLAYLRDRGLQIDQTNWNRAARFVQLELQSEIALQGWGEEGQFRARMSSDRPLQDALELLREASSTEALLSRVSSVSAEDR
jgi:carboxyl-terminal processing protease